ncbi:hypothetical protein [Zavarzinia sp.]|uniref:hypothetical protein n=1 Tax=Zavarzinia sp. TaxID=2027920 RepID=UPI0035684B93
MPNPKQLPPRRRRTTAALPQNQAGLDRMATEAESDASPRGQAGSGSLRDQMVALTSLNEELMIELKSKDAIIRHLEESVCRKDEEIETCRKTIDTLKQIFDDIVKSNEETIREFVSNRSEKPDAAENSIVQREGISIPDGQLIMELAQVKFTVNSDCRIESTVDGTIRALMLGRRGRARCLVRWPDCNKIFIYLKINSKINSDIHLYYRMAKTIREKNHTESASSLRGRVFSLIPGENKISFELERSRLLNHIDLSFGEINCEYLIEDIRFISLY